MFGALIVSMIASDSFDRSGTDLENAADRCAGLPSDDKVEDLHLTRGQPVKPGAEILYGLLLLLHFEMTCQSSVIAAMSFRSSIGFSIKSSAPALMAATAIAMSACPEMTTTEIAVSRRDSSRTSSMPFMPGIRTSATMQPA